MCQIKILVNCGETAFSLEPEYHRMRWNTSYNRQIKDCDGGGRKIVCTNRGIVGGHANFEILMWKVLEKQD